MLVADKSVDILAKVAGMWVGFFDSPETHAPVEALVEILRAAEWVAVGNKRPGVPPHRTP
ncbi:hypothetical protein J2X03_000776 [Microbacterium trichothecenolyticum]|nr:hypothetical protein [Microbacterium trichothecenolyticum]